MTPNLKPYPAYKDSGVSWLGKMPEHWEVRRVRHLTNMLVSNIDKHTNENEIQVRLCNYIDVYKNEVINEKIAFMKATASLDEINRFKVKKGDVAITKDSEIWNDIAVPALIEYEADDLVYGYHLAIFRPNNNMILSKYLFRSLQSHGISIQFHVSANGVTRFGLSYNAIKNVFLTLPPLSEQTAIVRFLDYMDRRIKRYINAKQKMIKLLSEYKQALIHQAVTGKIDVRTGKPYPSYKDSGVEWLGKVPEHWEVRRIKRIAHINPSKSEVPLTLRNGNAVFLPMERVGTNGHYDASDVRPILSLWNGFTYFRRGDIIVAKITPCFENGKGACLENLPTAIGFGSTEFHVIRPSKAIVTAYLYRLTTLSDFRRLGTDEMTGAAGQQRVPAEFIANFWVPLPPLPEQTAIVAYLVDQTEKIDTAIASTRKEIELLREYRERLIADVVTGKVDVREVAELLPEEAEEDIIDDGAEQAVFNEEDETTSEAENELKEETSTEDEL